MGGGDKNQHLLVATSWPEPKKILDRIREEHPDLKVTYTQVGLNWGHTGSVEGIPDEYWKDVTMLGTLTALPPLPKDAPSLEFIQIFSAGINHLEKHPIYRETDIPICTSSGIHGPAIAEWVIMTALVASRRYNMLHELQKAHEWPDRSELMKFFTVADRVGQRLAVLGYGSIGRQVARVATALGMDVIAYTAGPRPTPASKRDKGYWVPGTGDPDGALPTAWYSGLDKQSLHRFLAQDVDLLLVSLPLTPETHHLLGKEEFEILARRHAFVSNISRGDILVQEDLVAALKAFEASGGAEGLRGAALDVTTPEPLGADSELWGAPNVIVTPHVSGISQAYADRCCEVLEINVRNQLKGERLINVVDKKRGY